MSEVLREQSSDGIILLQLNRPERMNVLGLERKAFHLLFANKGRDAAIRTFHERRKPHFKGRYYGH